MGRVYVYDLLCNLLVVVSSTKMLSGKIGTNFGTIVSQMLSGDLFRGG